MLKRICWFVAALLTSMLSVTRVDAQVTFPGTELLGRPTDTSVTVNVVANAAIEAYLEYGIASGVYASQTAIVSAAANEPLVALISGLASDTRYFYRMVYRQIGASSWSARDEHSFQTQRQSGSSFTFTVTSDSHINILLGNSALYQRTLQNVDADRPDFHLDLGDTFAMDNVTTQGQARNAYLAQRPFMGLFSHSTPIFLVLGNHEQEEGWHRDDTGDLTTSKPILGANARKRYFLNPVPDAFYSGNFDAWPGLTGDGLPGDYYAWRWGDALFVAIDPYWYTTTKPFVGNIGGGEGSDPGTGDRWEWTLGFTQYQWLKQTLESSDARFKFIFAHHGTGGTDDYIRGGALGAPFTEWGGFNEDGTTWAFDSRRPGWQAPVHQLLVDNHVTAFFHGHDHAFAYEERDGVVYQLVPMAADGGYGLGFQNYRESDPFTIRVLPNSGHLRVMVSPSTATVDYVRAFLPGDGSNGEIAYSYTMTGSGGGMPGGASVLATPQGNTSIDVSWSGISAPSGTDWFGLYAPGAQHSAYLTWSYTSCSTAPGGGASSGACVFNIPSVPPGPYEIRLFTSNQYVLLATSNTFAIGTPGSGLAVTPTTIARGSSVTATWSGITTPTTTDWLGLYAAGSGDDAYLEWNYTSCSKTPGAGSASGACSFVVPSQLTPGTYEIRLFASNSFARIAASNSFLVTASGGGGPLVGVTPSLVSQGGVVMASWSGIGSPTATDWIGVYVPGSGDGAYLEWIYVSCTQAPGQAAASGSCPLVLPTLPSGTYELRLFHNDQFLRLATSGLFQVQ